MRIDDMSIRAGKVGRRHCLPCRQRPGRIRELTPKVPAHFVGPAL
jgi:hypothetical protein